MCIYHRKGKKADSWDGLKLLHLTELHYTCVILLLLYESSSFNCAKRGIGNRGRNVGDTQTCSMVVRMWAATIPNSSRAAPTKSVFVCIFITGVVSSKGDKTDLKKQWVYSKHSSVCTVCDASNTLFEQVGGLICTFCAIAFFAQNVLVKIKNMIKCYRHWLHLFSFVHWCW